MTTIKTYAARFKALPDEGGQTGRFEALVSVFGNVDIQGDRVLPKAFDGTIGEWRASAAPIPVVWSHDWGDPFAHIGIADPNEVEATDDGLLVRGSLDIEDNPVAKQVYRLIKRRSVKEWSFAYEIVSERPADDGANELEEVKIIEVGPTLKGANSETQTLVVKAEAAVDAALERKLHKVLAEVVTEMKTAIRSHSTATSDASWDAGANVARIDNDAGEATLRAAAAWVDPDGDPDAKSSYKFWHHEVDGDGNVGAANLAACSSAIGVLNGGRGGANIPDSDRRGVYNHAASHLRDGDREPPELKSLDEPAEAKNIYAPVPGSIEEVWGLLREAVEEWAEFTFTDGEPDEQVYAEIVATFADRVIVAVSEGLEEPTYWEMGYSVANGRVELEEPVEAEVEVTVVPKDGTEVREVKAVSQKDLAALEERIAALETGLVAGNGDGDDGDDAKVSLEDRVLRLEELLLSELDDGDDDDDDDDDDADDADDGDGDADGDGDDDEPAEETDSASDSDEVGEAEAAELAAHLEEIELERQLEELP